MFSCCQQQPKSSRNVLFRTLLSLSALCANLTAAEPNPTELLQQAGQAARLGRSDQAVSLLSQVLQQDVELADAYYLRGREHFRLGKIQSSGTDFDKYVGLRPEHETRLWERGITYFYMGKFAAGARQFSLYQQYHSNDVENAVWRFLCQEREEGVVKARKDILPIRNDRRIPMMLIYRMYRGEAVPKDVLRAADKGSSEPIAKNHQKFYAHLYVGLYYEALGQLAEARHHMGKAAEDHRISHYMWDVARYHHQKFSDEKSDR